MAAETQPASVPIDPALLAAFRQQAGAILAQERGLNAACRVKLAGLARQLGIPEDRIDVAIRSLGENAAPPLPADPSVEKFRNRLRKDLAGKSKAIIGPTIEDQIVGVATKKYGLPETVARQVVGEVAAEFGLMRISANEAVRNLTAQIDQAAGDATWLAKEGWDRLRVAGGKWGIALEVTDQLIDEKLAANRSEKLRRQFVTWAILFGTGGTLAIIAVVLLLLVVIWRKPEAATVPGAGPMGETPAVVEAGPPQAKLPPTWWDVDLSVAVASAASKFSAARPAYDLLISDAPAERIAGYQKLAELAKGPVPPAGLREGLAEIFSGSFALEPDEGAAGDVLNALLSLIPAPDSPLPKQRAEYDVAYWAGATAVRMFHRPGLSDARSRLLESGVQRAVRVSLAGLADRSAREKAVRGGITERLFEQLTVAAARHPVGVAVLFGYVSDLAVDLSDDQFSRLEATFLAAALPAAGKDWRPYQEGAVRAVSSPEPLNALKMLDAYQRASDPDLKQFLAELLIVRSEAKPKSWEPADVVAAVRKGLGITGSSAAITESDRWQLLKLRADAALSRTAPAKTDHAEWLAQTVELAHLTTLAIALAQGDAGYAVFDAQIEAPPQFGKSSGSPDDPPPDLPAPKRMLPPTPPQVLREVERYVDMIAAHARQQPVQRASAIRGLALLADRVPDLTPQQAIRAAEYIVAEKIDEENNTVVTALRQMRVWKRLRLAVADALPHAKLQDVQRQQVVFALAGSEYAESTSVDSLRQSILRSVLSDLDAATASSPALGGTGVPFDEASDLLAETYRARGRLFSASAGEIGAANSPAKALHLSIVPVANSLRPIGTAEDQAYLARVPHEATALGSVARDDLRRTVAINRVFVQLSARRASRMRPTQAGQIEQIVLELATADGSAASVLSQLRDHEAAALRIWMLYAPQI